VNRGRVRVTTVFGIVAVLFIGIMGMALPANAAPGSAAAAACRHKPQLSDLSLPATPVHSGAVASGTIHLSCAPGVETAVALQSGDSSWVTVPAMVTVPAGAAEADFTIQTHQPDFLNGQPFSVQITATLKGSISRPLALQPGLRFLSVDDHVISGDTFFVQVGLNGPAPAGGLPIPITIDNDAVHIRPITIPANAFGVAGTDGSTTRVPEDATVTITATLPGQTLTTTMALGAWTYDPGEWSLTGADSMFGGDGSQMRLDLQNPVPHGGVDVTLTSDDPKVFISGTINDKISLNEGATGADIQVFTANNVVDRVVTITATIGGVGITGGSRTHQIHVLPGLKQFEGIPFTVIGGESFEMTIRLSATTSQDLTVQLESDNPALQMPSEVVIPAGQDSATFTTRTSTVEDPQGVEVTARLGNTSLSDFVFIDTSSAT
jgi:hypothetical protein